VSALDRNQRRIHDAPSGSVNGELGRTLGAMVGHDANNVTVTRDCAAAACVEEADESVRGLSYRRAQVHALAPATRSRSSRAAASTFAVFGMGVAILALHQRKGLVVGLHEASFVFWLGAAATRVLVYPRGLAPLLRCDR
jgi:hypothetical protein